MSNHPQQLTLKLLSEECANLGNRCDDYHLHIIQRLIAIVRVESDGRTNAAKDIEDHLAALAHILVIKSNETEGAAGEI